MVTIRLIRNPTGTKSRNVGATPHPVEISVSDVVEEIEAEQRGKLDEQKGSQPDLEAAFFHLPAQGFEVSKMRADEHFIQAKGF